MGKENVQKAVRGFTGERHTMSTHSGKIHSRRTKIEIVKKKVRRKAILIRKMGDVDERED